MIYNRFEQYLVITEGYEITFENITVFVIGHEKYVKKISFKSRNIIQFLWTFAHDIPKASNYHTNDCIRWRANVWADWLKCDQLKIKKYVFIGNFPIFSYI